MSRKQFVLLCFVMVLIPAPILLIVWSLTSVQSDHGTPFESNEQKTVQADYEKPSESDEMRIGRLLITLEPGMSRADVEKVIGPPARTIISSEEGVIMATYYCTPPGTKGTQLMTVHYEQIGNGFRFREVRGPHFPDNGHPNPNANPQRAGV